MTTTASPAALRAALRRKPGDFQPPRSPQELYDLFLRLGFRVAWRPVVEGMDSPMEAFWAIYAGLYPVINVTGGRGSGKTRGLSLTEATKCTFLPRYGVAHIGAVLAQANRCYVYVQEYTAGPAAPLAWAIRSARTRDTVWRNGSHLEILAGTINAVSGGHPPMVVIDEFDLMDWVVFQQAVGMAQSTDDYASLRVQTSALYRTDGTMASYLRMPSPPKQYRWSVIDAMEPCDGLHGRPACLDAIAVRAGGPVSDPPHCPLWDNGCGGAAERATGHKKRQDVITELESTDSYTWDTQYLSKDAKRRGVVYEHFAPELSDDGSTNVTLDAEYRPGLDVYWMQDDGYEDPAVVLLTQRMPNGDLHVFDEVYESHLEHSQLLDCVHQPRGLGDRSEESWYVRLPGHEPRGPYDKPRRAYVDVNAKQLQRATGNRLRSHARVRAQGTKIMDGVQLVRRLVKDSRGHRSLRVHPRCANLIRELSYWRLKQVTPGVWIDEPEPNEGGNNPDHAADALRYGVEFMYNRRPPGVA